MKAKTLLAVILFSSVSMANAAITTTTPFTVSIAKNISGGNNTWNNASAADKTVNLAWGDPRIVDPIGDYVSKTDITGTLYNGSSSGVFKRNQFGAGYNLPEDSGSDTWLLGNAYSGGSRSATASNGARYLSFSLTAGLEDITINSISWDFVGAKSNTSNAINYATNVWYTIGEEYIAANAVKAFGSDWSASLGSSQNINTGVINAGGGVSSAILLEAGETIFFRIMMDSNSTASSVAMGVKNISVTGNVVPEPSTYALFGGIAAAGVALVVRRRRKA